MTTRLSATDLSVRLGSTQALQRVSLALSKRDFGAAQRAYVTAQEAATTLVEAAPGDAAALHKLASTDEALGRLAQEAQLA